MEFTIPPEYDGRLLREYLKNIPGLSGGILTELKKTRGGITVNGEHKTVRYVLKSGDVLKLSFSENEKTDAEPVDIPVDIIYEDDDMVAVNKPSGMPTHPSHNHHDDTLANALAYYYKDKSFVFRAANRLDNPTSGVVVVAKSRMAAYYLSDQFYKKQTEKTYYAVCRGAPQPASGTVNKSIKRKAESVIIRSLCDGDDGRACITDYECIKTGTHNGEKISLVKFTPHTGRTHQIRLHAVYLGTPISGDGLYGEGFDCGVGRLALHAHTLRIRRPSDGNNILLTAPVPDSFYSVFDDES